MTGPVPVSEVTEQSVAHRMELVAEGVSILQQMPVFDISTVEMGKEISVPTEKKKLIPP